MKGEEITIIKVAIAEIETRQEERDKTIFCELKKIVVKLDNQIEKHEKNAVAIGKVTEKANTNRNLFWILFGGLMILVLGIVAGAITGVVPVNFVR